MAGSYSPSLRVLACASCGAPLEVDLGGGRFDCTYCGSTNHLDARGPSEAVESPASSLSEMERIGRLREQDAIGTLPPSVERLVDDEGWWLRADRMDDAREAWLAARAQVDDSASFPAAEKLFHLTRLLSLSPNVRGRRAFLETAIEILPDTGHRHILRCMLSRLATQAGELEAAEEWLALCDPKPLDLAMDTAFRHARAILATEREEWREVLTWLGAESGAVPMLESEELACGLLRVHALEQLDRGPAARTEWAELEGEWGARVLRQAQRVSGLCPATARGAGRSDVEERLRAKEGELVERSVLSWAARWTFVFAFYTGAAAAVIALFRGTGFGAEVLNGAIVAAVALAVIVPITMRKRAKVRAELSDLRAELRALDPEGQS